MNRRYRLCRPEDFQRARWEGRTYHHRLFILTLLPNTLGHNRYGFITSKRLGKAVTRNRTKRVLREVMRKLHPHLQSGIDVVIVARQDIVGQPFWLIYRTVEEMVTKAGIRQVEGH